MKMAGEDKIEYRKVSYAGVSAKLTAEPTLFCCCVLRLEAVTDVPSFVIEICSYLLQHFQHIQCGTLVVNRRLSSTSWPRVDTAKKLVLGSIVSRV